MLVDMLEVVVRGKEVAFRGDHERARVISVSLCVHISTGIRN